MLKNSSTSTGTIEYFDSSLTDDLTILSDSGFVAATSNGTNQDVITYTAEKDCIAFLYLLSSNTGSIQATYWMARITHPSNGGVDSAYYDQKFWRYPHVPDRQPKTSGTMARHKLFICTEDTTTTDYPNYGFILPTDGTIVARLTSSQSSNQIAYFRLIIASADPLSFLNRYTR